MNEDFADYIGRQEVSHGVASVHHAATLAAILDLENVPGPGDVFPLLAHWLCFPQTVRQSHLGPDGHPIRDGSGLLPNTALPRRMWAGSRIRFIQPISLGASLRAVTTVQSIAPKHGKSGAILLVTLSTDVFLEDGQLAIYEERDLVYREAATSQATSSTAELLVADDGHIVRPNPVLLFRYCAATGNTHRIHYDHPYTTQVEGYPGLVVPGPLIATLLLRHFTNAHPHAAVREFSFRASSPAFVLEPLAFEFDAAAPPYGLRARSGRGIVMTASVAAD